MKKTGFIKIKKIIYPLTIFLGAVWNILCLIGILPLSNYYISYVIIAVPSMIVNFRSLLFKPKEAAVSFRDSSPERKTLAILTFVFFAAWVITLIACLAYRL